MKIKRYKVKSGTTQEMLLENGFKQTENASYVIKDAKFIKSIYRCIKKYDFEYSICVAFTDNIEDFNDFNNILVIDEDFLQPYTPFYGNNYGKDISDWPVLEHVIAAYNAFLDTMPFLEEVTDDA